jgi:hypothetical protein
VLIGLDLDMKMRIVSPDSAPIDDRERASSRLIGAVSNERKVRRAPKQNSTIPKIRGFRLQLCRRVARDDEMCQQPTMAARVGARPSGESLMQPRPLDLAAG